MRTGRTILASVIAATIAGGAVAGWLAFSLGEHTQAVVAAALYAAAPLIGSVWLGVYALCAVALVTTMLSRALRRAGAGITQNAPAIAADPDGLARFLPPAWHRFAAESRDIVF